MSEKAGCGPSGTTMMLLSLACGAVAMYLFFAERKGSEVDTRFAVLEGRARDAESARTAADQVHEKTRKDLQDRMEVLQKRVADLEATGRTREGELLAARAELERVRRGAEEEARGREAAEKEAERLRGALAASKPDPAPPDPPARPVVEVEKPVLEKAAPEKPPAPALGPTAISDPGQVRKLTDGLNTLLAGLGGTESWKIVSAEAVEEDRLVEAVLEARGADGTVSKSFKAGEARFVLQVAAGTLAIRMKTGAVTYPGKRTLAFPGGAYQVLLVVDPAPFRASGNPLVVVFP